MKEEQKRTALELSKFLKENGCELEARFYHCKVDGYDKWEIARKVDDAIEVYRYWNEIDTRGTLVNHDEVTLIPAYDILNDICATYADKFFGEEIIKFEIGTDKNGTTVSVMVKARDARPQYILKLIRQGKKQEAEEYIKENCLFNPKNK
jgi:hypothetical protein